MALTLRNTKGSELTYTEADANFSGLSDGTLWAATVTATATGTVKIGSAAATLQLGPDAPSTDAGGWIKFTNSSTRKNFAIGFNQTVAGALEIVPSTAAGGTTFSTNQAMFTKEGYFKTSDNGVYVSATGTYHEFNKSVDDGQFIARFKTSAATATNQYGLWINNTGDPNDATRTFIEMVGNATARANFRTNGGLANFSANNVNLSDLTVKHSARRYTETELEAFTVALEKTDFGVYKYQDQTHDDWNHGPSAQGVRAAFDGVADELVDEWSKESGLLAIYTHDLTNIALATLIHQNKKLRGELAAFSKRLH